MKFDMIAAGVGGQGILSIAFAVDNAALEEGLHFKQSEVHGMAQRGGAVVSHLRISDTEVYSDMVPLGSADIILSMEPLESLRYVQYLSSDGALITSSNPFINIRDYPEESEVISKIQTWEKHTLVNSAELARAAGNAFAQNIVMLGAAAHILPLKAESLKKQIKRLFSAKGEKVVRSNLEAYRLGGLAGSFYHELLAADSARSQASTLALKLLPCETAIESVKGWSALISRDGSSMFLEWLRHRKGLVAADNGTLGRLSNLDFTQASNEDFEAAVEG